MKYKFTAALPYIAVMAADFYLLPVLITGTGAAFIIMLCAMPAIAFACAALYGVMRGFDILLPLAVFALFIPTIFIYYNESAWFYLMIYEIITFAGCGIGALFAKKIGRR